MNFTHDIGDRVDDLPEGWESTLLSEVLNSRKGKRPARIGNECQENWVPYIDIEAFENGVIRRYADPASSTYVRNGSVVIVWDGARCGLVGRTPCDGALGSTLAVLEPQGISPEYALLFLQSRFDEINSNPRGTGIPHVDPRLFWGLEIPIPPPAEQKRIVAKVEELLARVNAGCERLSRVPAILKRFGQSVLAAACSGRLTADWRRNNLPGFVRPASETDSIAKNRRLRRGVPEDVDVPEELSSLELPEGWMLKSVAALLRSGALIDVKDGNHGSNHPKASEFTEQGLPFITAAQVKEFTICYEDAPRVSGAPLERLRVGFAKPGDVILTHKGSVGRSALNTAQCVLTPQTTYYRCEPRLLSAQYLVYYFASPHFYSQLSRVMSQTTRDFVPISEQYRLFVIVPSLEEQKEIAQSVHRLFALTREISGRIYRGGSRAEKLAQAILAKAYRGDLVLTEAELARAQGRPYEPASAILAHVRHEREAEGGGAKRRLGGGAIKGEP